MQEVISCIVLIPIRGIIFARNWKNGTKVELGKPAHGLA
jgi:hypothetical protein